MNLSRRVLAPFLFAIVLFAGPARTADLQSVRVGVLPNDDMISVLYAQQTGMFKDAGLEVQIDKSSANGSAIAAAVQSGAYDIGKSSITPIFDAYLHNVPFWIIATGAMYQSSKPYVGFLVPTGLADQVGQGSRRRCYRGEHHPRSRTARRV